MTEEPEFYLTPEQWAVFEANLQERNRAAWATAQANEAAQARLVAAAEAQVDAVATYNKEVTAANDLRDRFAMCALTGLVMRHFDGEIHDTEDFAIAAYAMADAMMAVKGKKL